MMTNRELLETAEATLAELAERVANYAGLPHGDPRNEGIALGVLLRRRLWTVDDAVRRTLDQLDTHRPTGHAN